jgi:hypothetical protein
MIQEEINKISTFKIIIFSSVVYSLFHFIKIPLIVDDNILWNTGLNEVLNIFLNFKNFLIIDAAITLLMFGILLGLIRVNFKTISYGIGIHSGFVFTIKTFKSNSSLNIESDYIYLLSNYDSFTGHLATIWITTLILLYMIFIYKKK